MNFALYFDGNPKDFEDRMQYCIDRVGSTRALASAIGVSSSTLGYYKTGKTDIPRKKILAVAQAARVHPNWLITGQGQAEYSLLDSFEDLPDTLPADAFIDGRKLARDVNLRKQELLESLKDYPELASREMVEALTTRIITPPVIEDVVATLLDYIDNNKIKADNETVAKAAAILCEMTWEKGVIDEDAIKRLLKFKGLVS